MLRTAVISAFALLGLAAPAAAQPAADDAIVVYGRTEAAMHAFVDQISTSPRSQNQLALWVRPLCLNITGVTDEEGHILNTRIVERARAVGLEIAPAGCRNNVLVLVSDNPDAVAQALAARPSDMGINNAPGRFSMGRRAFARFVASDAPVRWWHVNNLVTAEEEVRGERGDISNPRSGANWMAGHNSRLSSATRRDLVATFIIVDAKAVRRINYDWSAVGDYVSMVALAQLDPNANTSAYSTILNLFAQANGPRAMTEWDVAYLRGLYGATRDVSVARQQAEITASMSADLNRH